MVTNETKYKNESTSTISDLVGDYCPSLFYSHGTKKEGDLSLLSLFSGCGGMDIGFEGKFICNKKSIPQEADWVEEVVNDNWVLVKKNRFSTIFANDILPEAQATWTKYMERYDKDPSIYHLESMLRIYHLKKLVANCIIG